MRKPLLLFVVLLSACPEPTSGTPQIHVSPGAAQRMDMIPSKRAKKQPSANARAHVHAMKKGEELGGPNATGRAGDFVLENDEVVFVIDGLGGGGGFAESGGNLIDAADAHARQDELGQLFSYFGTFPRQGVYTKIDAKEESDGSAIVVSRGHELYEPTLEVETVYRLTGSDRALLMTTTIANTGTTKQEGLGLGDAIQWGGAEKFAPGKAVGFHGPSRGPFLGGIGRFTSYAITSTDGDIAAVSGGAWSDTEQKTGVALGPGEKVTYDRVFVVGERADAASVITELTRASGGAVGAIGITLVDAKGKPVTPAPGSKVVVSTPSGQDVMSIVAAGGAFGGEVPPGDWRVTYAPSAGRRGDGTKATALVRADKLANVTLAVSDVGTLVAGCQTKDPCKITVEGIDGTPTPELGPAHVASAARNQLFAAEAAQTIAIAPGRYRLTASRGPEFALETSDVTISAGSSTSWLAILARVVDTSGYVATDFHQHTMMSADAPVSTADRVRSSAVEGVEVAVATEHNVVADLEPVVKELGLDRFLVELPGDEITTDANKHAWGHANVYPLSPRDDQPRGGAFPVLGKTAKEVFADVRARGGSRVLQVNHPRSGKNGYFDQLGFDPKKGTASDPGYDGVFDAIEVWNGRDLGQRAKVLDDFLALLRTSHPVTPVGDTDTHGIVGQEAGYPRTYVRVTKDDAFETWDQARTDDLVKGVKERRDVVLTNGPFLRVSANGAPIGGVARAKGGRVDVKIHVEVAPWVVVDTLEIKVAGDAKPPKAIPLTTTKLPSGALGADVTTSLAATKDDACVVVVSGTKPLRPVLSGDDREIAPWAMSGPIWIDADGDGKSLGR